MHGEYDVFFFYSTSHVMLLFSDCMRSSGVDYRGEQQSSSSGLTCLNWTNTTRDYDVTEHPDSHTGKLLTQREGGGGVCNTDPVK